jgi:hypothetical protein
LDGAKAFGKPEVGDGRALGGVRRVTAPFGSPFSSERFPRPSSPLQGSSTWAILGEAFGLRALAIPKILKAAPVE